MTLRRKLGPQRVNISHSADILHMPLPQTWPWSFRVSLYPPYHSQFRGLWAFKIWHSTVWSGCKYACKLNLRLQ